jgi:hypothetical protein
MAKDRLILDYEPLVQPRSSHAAAGEFAWDEPGSPGDLPGDVPAGASAESARRDVAETRTGAPPRAGLLKPGHALSYAGVVLFTAFLLFRPYELIPALSFLSSTAYWLALATLLVYLPSQFSLEGNLTASIREVNLILLLCLTALLSIPLAISPSEAWTTFNDTFIKAVVIFIITVNVVRTEKRLRGLLYLSLGVTILLSVAAVNDYRAGNFPVEGYRIRGVIGGMFGNPNDLALHLVTMTPLLVVMMLSSRNPLGKLVYGTGAVLSVIANVVTYSRAGFLGLVGIAMVLVWKLGRGKRLQVSAIGGVCLALFIALSPGSYGIRILSIFIPSLDPVGSSDARKSILDRSVLVSFRHPLAGLGMGNFHIYSLGETVSHNAYTQMSSELGLLALLLYVMLIVASLRRLKRLELLTYAPRRRSRYYYLSVGLQASIIGYMISSFFAAVAYQWYVYYLTAYAVSLDRIYESQDAPAGGEETEGEQQADLPEMLVDPGR